MDLTGFLGILQPFEIKVDAMIRLHHFHLGRVGFGDVSEWSNLLKDSALGHDAGMHHLH